MDDKSHFVDSQSAVVQTSFQNGVDEEIINNIKELIINRTGMNIEIAHLGKICFMHTKFLSLQGKSCK